MSLSQADQLSRQRATRDISNTSLNVFSSIKRLIMHLNERLDKRISKPFSKKILYSKH